jgi:DNA (cytosine-5)-methyltransferase 1
VLRHHWPEVPQHDDVKTLSTDIVCSWTGGERVHILTGGYPCQPFSNAGQRRGEADDRHLWPWIAALVADVRPTWCLFENVAGHVTLGLDSVLADLEAQGYACWPIIVPAAGVGAPHRRDRVWIIARDVVDTDGQHRDVRFYADAKHGQSGKTRRGSWRQPVEPDGTADVADANDAGYGEQWRAVAAPPQQLAVECSGTESGCATETVSGMGDTADGVSGWMVGPGVSNPWAGDWERGVTRTVTHEADRTAKLRALGNAIVPQVAYEIMQAMLAADATE